MNINDVVIQKVKQLKNSEFKATAIKLELEAQLNRRSDYCEYCTDGREECQDCGGAGDYPCDLCNGSEEVENDEGVIVECPDCENGYHDCSNNCDNGYFECGDCGGVGNSGGNWSEENCQDFIMEELSRSGLATQVDGRWQVVAPLRFLKFYNDGSVDSEVTATILLDNPENVLLLPKLIEAWNKLCEAIGNEVDTNGAGMHMALLNSADGVYPCGTVTDEHMNRYRNFQRSAILLMPALFFLGSSSEASRGMNYRTPEIGYSSHRTAIDYRGGALEYRFFETCYDNPEQVLDNVVVMANTIKHWSTKYRKHGLSKITKEIHFGVDNSRKLDRFYTTEQHVDLLNAGLRLLKPSYRTITELKEQRGFKVSKREIKTRLDKERKTAEISYKEYEQRFRWQAKVIYYENMAHELDRSRYLHKELPEHEIVEVAKKKAVERVKRRKGDKTSVEQYVKNKLDEYQRATRGNYILREEA